MRHKWQGTGDRLPGREFVGLGTGSSSSLGSFRDRLPRERYRGSVGLGGFWGLAPRDRACARRKARGRGCFRAMCEGVRCSPSTLAPARSRCRWVAFGDRLLLLVRDRLPRGYLGGWGQAALGRSRCGLGWEGKWREMGTGCGPGVGRVFGGAPRDRACARRKARGRMSFRAMRRGWGVRLQCSLQHGPAAAGYLLGTGWACFLGTGCVGLRTQATGER